jgi:acetyl-CoA acetyltransferase
MLTLLSLTPKMGCSATMVALDTACKAIARGDCESAVVGGTKDLTRIPLDTRRDFLELEVYCLICS